ncbi:selection and upkeep of intraepithelial T-cells protein 4-like [Oryzias melastigma]|uniref:selection and upkeep of intraepithelial T-cells protein 4-like n=1 Tax=Oryzias melastigma TaxID=30732 RepID=UPI00168CD48E|nr:selection and upkeep of intraepithelial T-cells protein 4-like [Oryzias melastigma]
MRVTFYISFWISLMLSSVSCGPTEGESRLIGSDDPIMVAPGTDVILPCRLEFEMDLVNKTIEWSKVAEKTEPAKQKSLKTYVFLYRRGIQITAMMMQSYIQRTSMFYDRLRRGDMSLKIMNVTFEDNGIYECSLPRRQQRAKVQLVVSEFQFSSVGGPSLWINQFCGLVNNTEVLNMIKEK